MKQLFSNYPDGLAGVALLLLRGAAVALLVTIFQGLRTPTPWLTVAIMVVAAAILAGFGTRLAVVLCAVIAVPILLAADYVPITLVIERVLDLGGLALLGPGAISIDARLFGRRKISLTR